MCSWGREVGRDFEFDRKIEAGLQAVQTFEFRHKPMKVEWPWPGSPSRHRPPGLRYSAATLATAKGKRKFSPQCASPLTNAVVTKVADDLHLAFHGNWRSEKGSAMLIFTNRTLGAAADESAFERSFTPGSPRLAMANVARAPGGAGWVVLQGDADVDDGDSLRALLPLFQGSRPVLVYLHGNNNTPAACFERCDRLAALYDVEVIGFSWTSEGFLADGSGLPAVPRRWAIRTFTF